MRTGIGTVQRRLDISVVRAVMDRHNSRAGCSYDA